MAFSSLTPSTYVIVQETTLEYFYLDNMVITVPLNGVTLTKVNDEYRVIVSENATSENLHVAIQNKLEHIPYVKPNIRVNFSRKIVGNEDDWNKISLLAKDNYPSVVKLKNKLYRRCSVKKGTRQICINNIRTIK